VPPPAARAIAAAALLCGVIVVVAVPGPHDVLQSAQPREFPVAQSLLPLFIESAPALLIGLLLSSLLRVQMQQIPDGSAGPHTRANAAVSALRGWSWGLTQQIRAAELPSELGRLRSARAAPALIAGVCVAQSQLAVETLSFSLAWLGPRVTLVRVLGSVLLALLLGAACALYGTPGPSDPQPVHAPQPTRSARFGALWQQALDDSGPFIVLGLLLSAALEAALTPELLQKLTEPWDSVLVCALALFGRVSALGVTPLVAVLLHKGLALGAGLTLLWLSPLASIPLALWLGRRPGKGVALLANCVAAVLCISLGEVVERTLTKHGVPELHPLVTHDCSPWEYACAALLALLLVRSLVRLGPRGFASTRPPPATAPERTLCALPH
jgi:uncharacterized membrane protein YraQ (UPF0718 family)